jgi:hypothetical protein
VDQAGLAGASSGSRKVAAAAPDGVQLPETGPDAEQGHLHYRPLLVRRDVTRTESAIWYLLIVASGYLALTTLLSSVRSC